MSGIHFRVWSSHDLSNALSQGNGSAATISSYIMLYYGSALSNQQVTALHG